jgi:hypothetical protein
MAEEKQTTRRATSTAQQDQQQDSSSTSVLEQSTEQGYFGAVPDPTPNENYTVAGVTSGAPTPETDRKLHQQAREAAGFQF